MQGGLVARVPLRRATPFAHVLGGGANLSGPGLQPSTWGWGATGGAGLDLLLPRTGGHLAVRPVQADFVYSHVNFGPVGTLGLVGGTGIVSGYRLATGLTLIGRTVNAPGPVELACPVQPANINAGEPVRVAASLINVPARQRSLRYDWKTTGGHVTGGGETIEIDTTGLRNGDYTVLGRVSGGRNSQQALATCTSGFRVRPPLALTCSANPSTPLSGGTATITSSVAIEDPSRNLTYSFTASIGAVTGSTATTILLIPAEATGAIVVKCRVAEDEGRSAEAAVSLAVAPPKVTPKPGAPSQPEAKPPSSAASARSANELCTLRFPDPQRPTQLDMEAKACLDDLSLRLAGEPTAAIIIIGQYITGEETPQIAAKRTVNAQRYLMGSGIASGRIRMRTGGRSERTVRTLFVPVGAVADTPNTRPIE